jgi:RNA polymerase sigma-70 factor (ECF subfamily)
MLATDQELLRRISEKQDRALSDLYDRYAKLLYGMALTILHDTDEAEDVLQEVFVQVWKKASLYQPELGAPKNWLVRIAHNRAINLLRSRRNRQKQSEVSISNDSDKQSPEVAKLDSGDNPLVDVVRQSETESIGRALATLPEEQRILVELAFYQGYSHSEMAEKLSLPLGTVKTRIRSGIQALRGQLKFLKKEALS